MFDWGTWGYVSALALIVWLPFGLWRFTRVRPTLAAAQVMVWGTMWLPEGAAFDLPALPPFSKYTLSAIAALLGVWWKEPARLRAARIGRGYDIWIALMVLAQIGTVLTNPDPLQYGSWKTIHLPGFTAYDGIAVSVRVLLTVGVPCILGRALLRSERDLHDLLTVLAAAGVIYSLPILYELRMSPMLHENIYGYAPRSDWSQNLRAGGYRPTAFMGHGLVVGFFMFLSTTAAVALHKAGQKRLFGAPMAWTVAYLFVILVLCKAAAAIIYATVGFAAIRYLGPRGMNRLLRGLALLVISYPITRIADIFPVEQLLSLAGALGPDRVQSLQFRFDNEDLLLIKGAERLWFGWGGYAREHVYDPETAKDLVIQDGHWITVFGTSGLIGFVCFFALLILPLWQVGQTLRQAPSGQRATLSGLGFIVAICSINMLPNMQLPYLQFVFAMGLSTLALQLPKQRRASRSVRPSAHPSQRPSRRAPLRPVWYGDAPEGAYEAETRLPRDPRVPSMQGPHHHAGDSQAPQPNTRTQATDTQPSVIITQPPARIGERVSSAPPRTRTSAPAARHTNSHDPPTQGRVNSLRPLAAPQPPPAAADAKTVPRLILPSQAAAETTTVRPRLDTTLLPPPPAAAETTAPPRRPDTSLRPPPPAETTAPPRRPDTSLRPPPPAETTAPPRRPDTSVRPPPAASTSSLPRRPDNSLPPPPAASTSSLPRRPDNSLPPPPAASISTLPRGPSSSLRPPPSAANAPSLPRTPDTSRRPVRSETGTTATPARPGLSQQPPLTSPPAAAPRRSGPSVRPPEVASAMPPRRGRSSSLAPPNATTTAKPMRRRASAAAPAPQTSSIDAPVSRSVSTDLRARAASRPPPPTTPTASVPTRSVPPAASTSEPVAPARVRPAPESAAAVDSASHARPQPKRPPVPQLPKLDLHIPPIKPASQPPSPAAPASPVHAASRLASIESPTAAAQRPKLKFSVASLDNLIGGRSQDTAYSAAQQNPGATNSTARPTDVAAGSSLQPPADASTNANPPGDAAPGAHAPSEHAPGRLVATQPANRNRPSGMPSAPAPANDTTPPSRKSERSR